MADLDDDIATLVAPGQDSIFLTKYKEIYLYAMLMWNTELGSHQLIVRHKAEDLVNMTHVLRVFDHTKEGASKVFARKNKRTQSLLKGSKSFAGWHAYEGTFVTLDRAEKFVIEEFTHRRLSMKELKRNRSKLQQLKLLFHIDLNAVVRVPVLKDLIKLRNACRDPRSPLIAQDLRKSNSDQSIIVENHQAHTDEVDSCQMLFRNPSNNHTTGGHWTNDTSSQQREEEDQEDGDIIDDPTHNGQCSTPQEANLLSPFAISASSEFATPAFPANVFKRQTSHNVEEERVHKRQRTTTPWISLPILPARSVESPGDDELDPISNESTSLHPIAPRHSSSNRDILYIDHDSQDVQGSQDSQDFQLQISQHTQSSEVLGPIDIANRMHIVKESKIRINNLKDEIALMNDEILSLEEELQTKISRLEQKQKQFQQEDRNTAEHVRILKPILDQWREICASDSGDDCNNPSSTI